MVAHEAWIDTVDGFHAAALGQAPWLDPLRKLADLTGSKWGQLIGVGPKAVNFNWITDAPPEAMAEMEQIDGHNPAINSRVRAGIRARELEVLAEADFEDPSEPKDPAYTDFVRRHDIPFICLTNLVRQSDSVIGLAVNRSRKQGHVSPEEKTLFASIAPHVRAAVRTQLVLGDEGARLMAGGLEAVSAAAFILDGAGLVRAKTTGAEEVLRSDTRLRLRQGRLETGDGRPLAECVGPASATTVALRGGDGRAPLIVRFMPVPALNHGFGFGPKRIAVVLRPSAPQRSVMAIVAQAYGLTAAEAQIALDVADGLDPVAISTRRSVSPATVRGQLKAVFAKLGVRRQSELAALLHSFQAR